MRPAEPFTLEDCADDAAALLDQLGADRVIVVGYSMGDGSVGMLLARRHPARVKALVMQATALQWRDAHERMAWHLLSALKLGLRLGTGIIERVLRQATGKQPELEAFRLWLIAEFRRGLAPQLAGAGRALGRYDARPWAAHLGLPAAMLITTRDRHDGGEVDRDPGTGAPRSSRSVDATGRQGRKAIDSSTRRPSR